MMKGGEYTSNKHQLAAYAINNGYDKTLTYILSIKYIINTTS